MKVGRQMRERGPEENLRRPDANVLSGEMGMRGEGLEWGRLHAQESAGGDARDRVMSDRGKERYGWIVSGGPGCEWLPRSEASLNVGRRGRC